MAEIIRRALDGYLDDQPDPRAALAAPFAAAPFVGHLRGAKTFDPRTHRVHYSVVTRAELFAENSATEDVTLLLAPFCGVGLGRDIAGRAGRLRRESGIRLPNALIAATAVEDKLSLFTRNRSDIRGRSRSARTRDRL